MLNVRYSTRFKKDFKTCVKHGYKMVLLPPVIYTLRIPAPLLAKNREHNLSGNFSGYRECHIAPDWLLTYNQSDTKLLLDRTGTHANLFGM